MNLDVFLDFRWKGGVLIYSEGFYNSIIYLEDLIRKGTGKDANINVYILSIEDGGYKYYKLYHNKLKAEHNKDIINFVRILHSGEYRKYGREISLDEIIENSKYNIKLFSNYSIGVFNRPLIDNIENLIDDRTIGTFHGDPIRAIIVNLYKFTLEGKLSLAPEEFSELEKLYKEVLKHNYTSVELVKRTLRFIDKLYNSNKEFMEKFSWIIDEIDHYKKIIETIEKNKSKILFPTLSLYHAYNSMSEAMLGKNIAHISFITMEPHHFISILKKNNREIEEISNEYMKIYGENSEYNLNGKIKYWIIFNGRTGPDKGMDSLLNIVDRLLSEGKEVGLIIISPDIKEESKEYKKLEEIVKKHKGKTVVHIYGDSIGNSLHENPIFYISLLKALGKLKRTIFVNPANIESFGLATIEAISIGELPVVYRDIEGLSNLKEEGYLKRELGGKTDEELYTIIKNLLEGIENGRYDELVDKEVVEKLRKEMDPEDFARRLYRLIEMIIKEKEKEDNEEKLEKSEVQTQVIAG
ncbi:MAG: glycosyltransferase [Nanopusillaceae archaeon]